MKKTREKIEQDRAVAAFFEQAIKDGRMTREELRATEGVNETGRGKRPRKKILKTFADFMRGAGHALRDDTGAPCEGITEKDVVERFALVGLTRQDVELFINYPEHTEAELAEEFGLSHDKVNRTLARVRKTWPSLRFDVPVQQKDMFPDLEKMLHPKDKEGESLLDTIDRDSVVRF